MKLRISDDVDFSAAELDRAGGDREKRIIPADTYVLAGKEFRSALTDDYAACFYNFSGIQLNASVFGVTVSAVSC